MCLISLQGKTNFFERRVADYAKATKSFMIGPVLSFREGQQDDDDDF